MARRNPHKGGQKSVFAPKDARCHITGRMTYVGAEAFAERRKELAALYDDCIGEEFGKTLSDGDVVEYLARGKTGTMIYLRQLRKALTT